MEILGFSIVCSLFSFIGVKFKGMGIAEILGGVIESAGGEAVEEAIESVLGIVFPKSFFYIRAKRAEKQILTEQLLAMIRAMANDGENGLAKWRELQEFLRCHAVDGKKEGVCICGDMSDKKALKEFGRALKELYKNSKSKQTARIHFLTGEALVREVYGIRNADERIPEAVLELSDLIGRHVYERLYIGLSSEDRDLAKVIQFMLISNNKQLTDAVKAEIRETLKDTLSIILQHHEDGTLATLSTLVTVDREKKVPADPYFYTKLVCPECGATADHVHRHGDRVFCRCCGGSYDIVRNAEPEVVEKIAELEVRLEERLAKNGVDISTQVRAQLREMAEKAVSAEYFDRAMATLRADTAAAVGHAARSVTLDVARLEEGLSQRMDGVEKYLEALQRQEAAHAEGFRLQLDRNAEAFRLWAAENAQELERGLTATIRRENRNLQMQALMMQNQLTQIDAQTGEALMLMRAIESKGVSLDADSLQKIGDFMNRFERIFKEELEKKRNEEALEKKRKGGNQPAAPVAPSNLHERVCPTCGGRTQFKHIAGENSWECQTCGATVEKRLSRTAVNPPLPTELKCVNGRVRLQIAAEAQGCRSDYDARSIKIRLRYTDLGSVRGKTIDVTALNGIRPEQMILCADSACDFVSVGGRVDILSQLLVVGWPFSANLQKLVLGENVRVSADEFMDDAYAMWKRSAKDRNAFVK